MPADNAHYVRLMVDALPPSTWDVSVWPPREANTTYVTGRMDVADVHRIVGAILHVAATQLAGPPPVVPATGGNAGAELRVWPPPDRGADGRPL